MTEAVLLEKLSILSGASIGFELFFITKSKEIKKVDLDIALSNNLKSCFIDKIIETFNDEASFKLRSILDLSSEKLESEYFYFDNDSMYEDLQFIIDFAEQETCDSFALDDSKYKNIDAILMKIGTRSNHIILYKHHYPVNVVTKKSTINIFKKGDTFEEVTDDIFKIDINFDLLLVDEHLIVNKLKTLESKLGYSEVIYATAHENIEIINALCFIEDLDFLKESIKNNRFAKKLNKVQKSPVIKIIENEQSKVVDFIKGHPTLKQIKFTDDGKLVINSKASVERFLKLLDDDYLHSQLTEMLYDTNSKDTINA